MIDNRGGAGGTLGASYAAKLAPDGYNFFMGGTHHVIAPSMYPRLDYDLERDFIALALLASVPQVLVVNPRNVPHKTVQELLSDLRKRPGKLNLRLGGRGHLAPPGRRAVQAADQYLHHPHSLSSARARRCRT